jgi:3-deoxy-D-manno-octulosonic-acid transferase
MYLLYSTLLALAILLGSPYWIFEALRHGKYRQGFFERLGRVPARFRDLDRPAIWVHAVSVGEVLAVSELVGALRRELPEYQIVISTTTDTGQKLAASRFGVHGVFYFPFDFAFAVRPWFSALKPRLIVISETEFWPNFLRISRHTGAHVMVVNARISDRSFGGYKRWKHLLEQVLRAVELFLAQTDGDARRLVEIGVAPERVVVSGNLKYDVPPPADLPIVHKLRTALRKSNAGPVLVCGSTVEGEERILLGSFRQVLTKYPESVMFVAPRHPERFDEVAQLFERSQLKFCRRSQLRGDRLAGEVMLIDSIGELSSLYALADIAFIGGSLVARGGHNILEPAQHGVPILVGEHTENFRDIVELFKNRDAVRVINPTNMAQRVLELLANAAERNAIGRRAKETLESQQGATQLTLEKVRELLASSREVTPA